MSHVPISYQSIPLTFIFPEHSIDNWYERTPCLIGKSSMTSPKFHENSMDIPWSLHYLSMTCPQSWVVWKDLALFWGKDQAVSPWWCLCCFLKWWYPKIIQNWWLSVVINGKINGLRYPYCRKPPYDNFSECGHDIIQPRLVGSPPAQVTASRFWQRCNSSFIPSFLPPSLFI